MAGARRVFHVTKIFLRLRSKWFDESLTHGYLNWAIICRNQLNKQTSGSSELFDTFVDLLPWSYYRGPSTCSGRASRLNWGSNRCASGINWMSLIGDVCFAIISRRFACVWEKSITNITGESSRFTRERQRSFLSCAPIRSQTQLAFIDFPDRTALGIASNNWFINGVHRSLFVSCAGLKKSDASMRWEIVVLWKRRFWLIRSRSVRQQIELWREEKLCVAKRHDRLSRGWTMFRIFIPIAIASDI